VLPAAYLLRTGNSVPLLPGRLIDWPNDFRPNRPRFATCSASANRRPLCSRALLVNAPAASARACRLPGTDLTALARRPAIPISRSPEARGFGRDSSSSAQLAGLDRAFDCHTRLMSVRCLAAVPHRSADRKRVSRSAWHGAARRSCALNYLIKVVSCRDGGCNNRARIDGGAYQQQRVLRYVRSGLTNRKRVLIFPHLDIAKRYCETTPARPHRDRGIASYPPRSIDRESE